MHNAAHLQILDNSTVKAYVANEQHVYEVGVGVVGVLSGEEVHTCRLVPRIVYG